jgi:hypothetical protein
MRRAATSLMGWGAPAHFAAAMGVRRQTAEHPFGTMKWYVAEDNPVRAVDVFVDGPFRTAWAK